ncbi:MAG: hypothetical protein EPN31_14900 [Castellaniella sp.]|uniref:hypothetical protein n=1 Tax=Castellaniella sp. TaxID=1955812 RepID=UPI00121296BB|nr:hypothetical protein [Castellaniella sp.]TAN25829.1 MAG: hypothetical protein EPN31_14900 [Castellaniella sp.]
MSCSVPPFVVLDAYVLMSTLQRRLLLRVANQGVFRPIWTERIGEEWRCNAAPYEGGLRYSDPKDFNRSELRHQGLDVYSPDQLLAGWWQAGSSCHEPPQSASRASFARLSSSLALGLVCANDPIGTSPAGT